MMLDKTAPDGDPADDAEGEQNGASYHGKGRPSALRAEGDPALSLIVCTVGRGRELERLLTSLAEQRLSSFEVILVDQSPDDRLSNMISRYAARFPIKHLHSLPGLSKARNVGLRSAKGGVIGFPDDDCWYETTTVHHVTRLFAEEPHLDVLLGRTLDQNGAESLSPFRRSGGPVTRMNVWRSGNSNTLFVRASTAHQIGFDESLGVGASTPFKAGEETDFVLRALALGRRVLFERDLVVRHPAADAQIGPGQLDRARAYSTGIGYVLRKHRYGPGYLFYRTARSFARCLTSVATLDLARARYKFIWAVGTLRGYFSA
jgi:glycosyltransferase involved in cell wall biosynthesis